MLPNYTDFDVGRGETAEWIGSLRGQCYPDTFLAVPPVRLALTATEENLFRAAVADALEVWEDDRLGQGYPRYLGWPWPWLTSHKSRWVIAFDPGAGAVFVTVGGGVAWHPIDPHDPRFPEGDDPLGPPDMLAWLRNPAAPPSVPLPLMRDPVTGFWAPAGDAW